MQLSRMSFGTRRPKILPFHFLYALLICGRIDFLLFVHHAHTNTIKL